MSKKFLYIMSVLPWLFATSCNSEEIKPEVDNILVEKANRKLYLRKGDEVVREYSIGLGGNPIGHKQQEGDNRTPEGSYIISGRNPKSSYHLSLRISYPNEQDKKFAKERGVSPGGDIMIHGYPNKVPSFMARFLKNRDWTQGCIAVSDDEIEEIWDLVANNTPIKILP